MRISDRRSMSICQARTLAASPRLARPQQRCRGGLGCRKEAVLCLNTKSRYGIAALVTLAAAHEQGLLHSREITRRNNIPSNYLEEQIFILLTGAEIVQNVRGKNGGYRLVRPPATIITLLDAIKTLVRECRRPAHGTERADLELARCGEWAMENLAGAR